ncbi:MAG: DUF29 domain-containing protein [Bryobacteraceae bacterium]|nr:DUF29 domain-containing protein [Bryobacteraceae bacterium]
MERQSRVNPSRINDDPYLWAKQTVEALRARDWSRIDIDELIDEISSILRSSDRELQFLLRDILEGLLIIRFSPEYRREAERILASAHGQMELAFITAPSLRDTATPEFLATSYQMAREYVEKEYRVSLPEICPFSVEEALTNPLPPHQQHHHYEDLE